MGNPPINNQKNIVGTGPLRRADPPKGTSDLGAVHQDHPAVARDQADAKAPPAGSTGKINLDGIKIPEVKIESNAKPAEPAKKPEEKGFFGKLWDDAKDTAAGAVKTVEHVADVTVHAVEVTADVVGAGVHKTVDDLQHGKGLITAVQDGAHASAKVAFDKVVDPTLTKSSLGAANEYHDKAAGALGPLLTNRLAIGESVSIKIEAGATIPTEIIGAPNVKLDGGGELKIKRVLAEDANGKAIMGADGKQETRLEVQLEATGRAGAAYSAKVGFQSTVQGFGHEAGVKASASAEAEAGLSGRLTMKLRFNPDSEKDMGDLAAMTKATAATGAAVAVPGLGAVLAMQAGPDYKRALNSLGSHLESVEGEGGLYAQANASAKLGVGIFKAEPKAGDPAGGAPPPKTGNAVTNFAKDKAMARVDEMHENVLDKLKLEIGQVGGGVGGEVKVGGRKNARTGESAIFFDVNGAANVNGAVLGVGKGAQVDGQRKVSLNFDRNGELKDVAVQQTVTKAQFQAIQNTVADVYGRPIDPGFIAKMGSSDTVTLNYTLKPEVLAQIKAAKTPGDMARAAKTIAAAAITKDAYRLKPGDIVSTHRDELAFRFNVDVALGAEVAVRGGLVAAHEQETTVK